MMPSPRLREHGTAVATHFESLAECINRMGTASLSNEDLLSALLGRHGSLRTTAAMQRVLVVADGLVGIAGLGITTLRQRGLTQQGAIQVAVAFELSRRLSQANRRHRHRLTSPESVMESLGTSMLALDHEELWLLALDSQSRLLGEPRVVSIGDVDGTDAGPRAFFRLALNAGATSAIAVHNHPSGDVTPSAADIEVTRRLVLAGVTIDVPLADHVVVGSAGRFTSIRRYRPELFVR